MKSDSAVLNDVRALQQAFKERRDLYILKQSVLIHALQVLVSAGTKKINKRIASQIELLIAPAGLRGNYHPESKELVVWGGAITYDDRMTIKLGWNIHGESAVDRLNKAIAAYAGDINAITLAEGSAPYIVMCYAEAKEKLAAASRVLLGTPFQYLVPELP